MSTALQAAIFFLALRGKRALPDHSIARAVVSSARGGPSTQWRLPPDGAAS